MENFLIYIGKSALAAAAFFVVYLALFQNRKQFTFNRIYLPVSLLLSFVIPLITFTTIKYIEPVTSSSVSSFAYLPIASGNIEQPGFIFEWYHYLLGLYILGVFGFLIHLLLGHLKAINIVKKSKIHQLFQAIVNVTYKDIHPFSFFNKIVLSEKTLSHPNLKMIISHENIHVKEKHTLDILFAEILFLFQWFNPFAWLLKDAIKNNLEYKTDHQIAKTYNPQTYQLAMVGLADKEGVAPFLTALNGSQLKNRIIMMKKKTENKYAFLKQLVVLPLLAILVMGLSNREVKNEVIFPVPEQGITKTENVVTGKITDPIGNRIPGASILVKGKTAVNVNLKTEKNNNEEITIDTFKPQETDKELIKKYGEIFHKVEEMPQFPGGETALKKYIANSIKYPEIAIENGIQGKVYVSFIIDKSGKVNDPRIPRGVDPALDKEALRVVSKLPKWKPGKQRGKIVNVSYTVPVNFILTTELTRKYDKVGLDGYPLKKESDNTGNENQEAGENTQSKDTKGTGYGTQIRPTTVESHVNASNTVFLKTKIADNEPLYIVDGIQIENLEDVIIDDIESISVLKDASATALYGEKGKNGVILVTTKKKKPFDTSDKLIILDGVEYEGKISDIDSDNIERVDVLKEKSGTEIYGDKGKNGVILIYTKNANTTEKEKPLIVTDGIITGYQSIDDIDPENIKSINVLKDESANSKYGDKGKNGVIEITLKKENITSELQLRKFIAKEIKYPVIAQKANREKAVRLFAQIDKKGRITDIKEKSSNNKLSLDEVVVVSYKTEDVVVTGYGTKEEAEAARNIEEQLLVDETKRVINNCPVIDIPEYKGKSVQITVKFILQD